MADYKECWRDEEIGPPIVLSQAGPDDFRVTYGQQVKASLTYRLACYELGAALLHALSCEGMVDNRDPRNAEAD